MAKVISFSNFKGGVGKSISTCNIGAALAKQGVKTLLLDMDPQSNLTLSLGLQEPTENIYGVLRGDYDIKKPIQNISENLDLLPSNIDLAAAEIELSAETAREQILKEHLESIQGEYDLILIDTAPSMGLLTINALTASNEVYIPLQAHFLALSGLKKLVTIIDKVKRRLNPSLEIGGVFITQLNPQTVLGRDVAKSIEEHFGEKVFKTRIRQNIALAEAPSSGKDIFQYSPKSAGAKDYHSLSLEVAERLKVNQVIPVN